MKEQCESLFILVGSKITICQVIVRLVNMIITILFFLLWSSNDEQPSTVSYLVGAVAEVENMAFSLEDGTIWRFTTQISKEPDNLIVIIGGNVGNSGMAYFEGKSYPVTLIEGTPKYERGFLTSLIFVDRVQRTLFLSDGTTRRVTNTEYEFNFRSDGLNELIITQDRRFAVNLFNPELIPISPPLRNR